MTMGKKGQALRIALVGMALTGACSTTLASTDGWPAAWPRNASGALAPGTAVVSAKVAPDGHVLDVRLVKGSGNPAHDDQALKVVRARTFKPFSNDAGAPPRWVQMPVIFEADART